MKRITENGFNYFSTINNVLLFLYFYSKAHETEQLLTRQSSVIKGLAQFYAESRFYRETETELERLSGVDNYRRSAFKEITYGTTFCHQVTWIIWRSFKNWLGHLQPWIVQVILQILLGLLWNIHVGVIWFWRCLSQDNVYLLPTLPFICLPCSIWDIETVKHNEVFTYRKIFFSVFLEYVTQNFFE